MGRIVLVSRGESWTPVCDPSPEATVRRHVSCGSRPWQLAANAWLNLELVGLRRRLCGARALAADDAVVVARFHARARKALENQRLRLLEGPALLDALGLERQQIVEQVVLERERAAHRKQARRDHE